MSKTPISLLQEILVRDTLALPKYYEADSDLHEYRFKCNVKASNIAASGYGNTKKEAKHASARKALELMGVNIDELETTKLAPSYNVEEKNGPCINSVGRLNEFASSRRLQYPIYHEGQTLNGMFSTVCLFVERKTEGTGRTKKDSKQDAARAMLESLRMEPDIPVYGMTLNLEVAKNFEVSDEILKKYEQMSLRTSAEETVDTTEFVPPELVIEFDSLKALEKEFERRGRKCKFELFQEDPYIMMMKVLNNDCVVMAAGETKEEATRELIITINSMIADGFGFKI